MGWSNLPLTLHFLANTKNTGQTSVSQRTNARTEREEQKGMIQDVVHERVGRGRKRKRGGEKRGWEKGRVQSGETHTTLIGHGSTALFLPILPFSTTLIRDNGPRKYCSLCPGLQFLQSSIFCHRFSHYERVFHLQNTIFVGSDGHKQMIARVTRESGAMRDWRCSGLCTTRV